MSEGGLCARPAQKKGGGLVEYVDFGARVSNVAFGPRHLYVTGEGSLWRLPLRRLSSHAWWRRMLLRARQPSCVAHGVS